MSDLTVLHQLAHKLARPRARRSLPKTQGEVGDAIRKWGIKSIPTAIWQELADALVHHPPYARALAQVLTVAATQHRDAPARARAEIAYLHALNLCCDFRQVVKESRVMARRFEKRGEREAAARVWIEAALAHAGLGSYDAARTALAQSQNAKTRENEIRRQWVEAGLMLYQGDAQRAAVLYQNVSLRWRQENDPINAMRAQRDLAHASMPSDIENAKALLAAARAFFVEQDAPFDVAACDYFQNIVFAENSEFEEEIKVLNRVRAYFAKEGIGVWVGMCDMSSGLVHHYRSEFTVALEYLARAHKEFVAEGLVAEALSCQLNIGLTLTDLHRYEEAVIVLEQVAKNARALGERKKHALCLVNLGWARTKQGRFADALQYYALARAEYQELGLQKQIALYCDINEGNVYLSLGHYTQARRVLEPARSVLKQEHIPHALAECEIYLAQVYLATGQYTAARKVLENARKVYAEVTGQPAWVGECNRLLATLAIRRGDFAHAEELVAEARRIFIETEQFIELALTEVVSAEVALARDEREHAAQLFETARERFGDALPDFEWRAEYGLGRVAEANAKQEQALAHYLSAIETIASVRGTLVTETWSNTFFGARLGVYEDALRLAYARSLHGTLLDIIEAAKARLLSVSLTRQEWRAPGDLKRGTHARVHARVLKLQKEIQELQKTLTAKTQFDMAPGLRGANIKFDSALNALQETRAHYEDAVTQIRLAQHGLEGAPEVDPFALQEFRAEATKRFGTRWAGLAYYSYRGGLLVVTVEPERVRARRVRLSRDEQHWLQEFCNPLNEKREMYYRGTLHGFRVERDVTPMLSALTRRLVPEWIRAREDEPTLLISPHGILHQLPFHALSDEKGYLLERFGFLYTPSLQVWTQLAQAPTRKGDAMLVCGVQEFGGRASDLRFVGDEMRALKALGGSKTRVWGENKAQHAKLLEWNKTGALRDLDILHFATHAIVDMDAPHWSRIFLADGDLSIADVLDLSLNARLVTLSGCSTARGTGGAGDEWVALARAFFYAGAQTVVATQWSVEDDKATCEMMEAFYQHLKRGGAIADALRDAQLQLLRSGKPPYLWAAYTVVGKG